MKRMTRVVSTGVAASLAALLVAAAPAGASTAGVGTTATKTSVLSFQLGTNGSLLNLGLLTDVGGANIDPHNGTLRATDSLIPITLASPTLGLDLSTPAITTLSPGGQSDSSSQAITLSGLGIPPSIATATIKPAALHSDFATSAARTTMTSAEVDNLTLLGGGLLSVNLLSSNLGADALSAQANGTRGVDLSEVKVLDLGALLKGIGGDLLSLPVGSLSGLVSKLGVPVSGLAAGSSLSDQVTSLSNTLTDLRNTVASAVNSATSTAVSSASSSVLGGLNVPVPAVGSAVSTVNSTIGTVQNTLVGLLSNAAAALDSFPLIQVSGTQVGIATKAADTLANSAASASVTPIKIIVAGQQLTVDLQQIANTINSVVDTANSALNGVLSGVLGLPNNLVTVKLLEKATNVSQNGSYTSAVAGLSLLHVGIAAINPAIVSGALAKLTGPSATSLLAGTPLGSVLGSSNAMSAVNAALGNAAPLLGGAQLQVASLAGASTYTFATPTAPGPVGTVPTSLPHTGGNPALALMGIFLAFVALAGVRFARMSRLNAAKVKAE
jgi:hypothetical protein